MDVGSIASLGLWLFLAVVILARTWGAREAQKTIRMAIEKGHTLDPAVIDRLLPQKQSASPAGGVVVIAVGLGLPVMGSFIGRDAFYPLLGVGSLLVLVGVGLLGVWMFERRRGSAPDAGRG